MRPLLSASAILVLAACATTDALPVDEDGNPPVRPVADTCTTDDADRFIGQRATQELGRQVLEATDTRELRWIQPGIIVTANYKYGRVTVAYDEDMIVRRVSCG